jgi:methionine-rich copper-binding protein CopC
MSRSITSFGAALWGGVVTSLVVMGMVNVQEAGTEGQRPRAEAPQVQKVQMKAEGRQEVAKRGESSHAPVDIEEARAPLAAPTVSAVSPVNSGIGVGIAAKVQATFGAEVQPNTTISFTLTGPGGTAILGRYSYNNKNNTATFDPNVPLAYSTSYTATVTVNGAASKTWSFTTGADPTSGPGGPILVVTSPDNHFSSYYAEILRSEGLNEFETAEISKVSAGTVSLTNYDVVILGQISLTPAQVTMFSDWVNAGGRLIAMRPDKQLASLLGLTVASSTPLSDKYLLVNTASGPGLGITDQTIQYHGEADLYTLNGASSLAILYSDATTATPNNPAVTLRNVGPNGGQAAAFTYDLASSVVYTHQGNPAWDGQERDGSPPIRSDDLSYGAKAGDIQPDYVDLAKDSVPGADEQQRFLANLITQMDLAKKPLPRFWYFPDGAKAMVLESGDDHANGGTACQFDTFLADGTSGGQPIRASSYIYTNTQLTDAQAASYTADGFEVGLHPASADGSGNPIDWTPTQLDSYFTNQLSQWQANFPSLPTPSTNRTHGIVWSTYSDEPQIELNHRIRLDTNYYYWPGSWIQDRPGLFTGSGMPMRFATKNGAMIDTYQATTQMTDESGQSYPKNIGALLNIANGPQGYYGVFTVNAHTDAASSTVADNVISTAQLYNNPVVSGRQLLGWLDYRNNSSFGSLSWNTSTQTLSFTITTADNASGLQGKLQAMVPLLSAAGKLTGITQNGSIFTYTTQRIKGVDYAFFMASPGSYTAQYAPDTQPPAVVSRSPAPNATGVDRTAAVTAIFSEDIDPATISTDTFTLTGSSGPVTAAVTYDTASKTATLRTSSGLASNTTYMATISGAQDVSHNALSPVTWSFTTSSTVPRTSIWNSPTALPDENPAPDTDAVELGVKFRSLVAGTITGIRFFKGDGNTGTHVGHLWSSTGELLASATYINETASGWQQANFDKPVPIDADTTYVASYFAPNGNYAATISHFSDSGIDSWPLRALKDGEDGSNGVFVYGPGGGFPTSTYNASNYWVDVVFTSAGGQDTTPPTVTGQSPAPNTTGITTATTVTATFSESVQPGTIAFTLTGPNNAAVPGNVTYTDISSHTATFTPTSPLANSTTYTAIVGGAKDQAGNTMAAPVTWSFTTANAVPPSIWSCSATPAVASAPDPNAVELGVKFRADVAGTITGVRFYKGSTNNTGTHVGHLWSSTGELLASATYINETASGWQQANFDNPVPIRATTTYVASYFAPNGNYAFDRRYFATSGVDNAPLHALRDGVDGGNGVFVYGPGGGFPTSTYNASNYWVDVVFSPSSGIAAPAAPTTAGPTIISIAPKKDAIDVNTTASLAATFSGPMDPETINGSTVTLVGPSRSPVPVAITYSKGTNTVRLTPTAALNPSTTYTVTFRGGPNGVKGPTGALPSDFSWNFRTVARLGGGPLPEVTHVWPPDGASGVDPRSNVLFIVFSREMDPTTINESTIQLHGRGIGPRGSVPYRVTYGRETQSVTIKTMGLLPSTPYTVTIKGGVKGVKDQKGKALIGRTPGVADQTIRFTTGQARR